MNKRQHYSTKTGKMETCSAKTPESCTYSGTPHFDEGDPAGAEYARQRNKENNSLLANGKQKTKETNHLWGSNMPDASYDQFDKKHGMTYGQRGWKGDLRGDKYISAKDVCKEMRPYLKEVFPECKFSVTSPNVGTWTSRIEIYILESPYKLENDGWDDEYDNSLSRTYDKRYTEEGKILLHNIQQQVNRYNYDDSDIQSDYFDRGFYERVEIGKWDKPYQMNNKKEKTILPVKGERIDDNKTITTIYNRNEKRYETMIMNQDGEEYGQEFSKSLEGSLLNHDKLKREYFEKNQA